MAMWGQNRDLNKNAKIKYVLLLFVLKCYINFESSSSTGEKGRGLNTNPGYPI
jgi:hypothetical protein